jgi:hypothetical protein
VTDLERLFGQLVRNLAAGDSTRLRQPLSLGDIRNSILPYRANRRALQLESSEDYELVLMRLCAGEGGFARTEPPEARVEFEMEIGSPNPDLTLVERHEKAVVSLDPTAVTKALDPRPDLAYAPQDHVSYTPPTEKAPSSRLDLPSTKPPKAVPRSPDPAGKALRCPSCGGSLPVGRVVNFCPQCGQNLTRTRCPECKTELEQGWRHCVNCGRSVGDG